ncbi:MAG: high-affinity nickel-transport family protein [Candidatus Rokuibacteriota bacterium]
MGEPVVSAIVLGFVLGLQHATDPDHLVALATILSRERRFTDGALIGLSWGVGHAATLMVAGGLLVALGARLSPGTGTGLELLVAAMIVGLGAFRLRDALRGLGAAGAEHLLAEHEHDGSAAFHSHPHAHGTHRHAHPHVHPSKRLLAALDGDGRRAAARAVLIGVVHGLAGTAAVSLLVLTTMPSVLASVIYLAVFGLGTIIGMVSLTAVLAWPVSLAHRFRVAHRALALGSGLGAICFGLLYAVKVL